MFWSVLTSFVKVSKGLLFNTTHFHGVDCYLRVSFLRVSLYDYVKHNHLDATGIKNTLFKRKGNSLVRDPDDLQFATLYRSLFSKRFDCVFKL